MCLDTCTDLRKTSLVGWLSLTLLPLCFTDGRSEDHSAINDTHLSTPHLQTPPLPATLPHMYMHTHTLFSRPRSSPSLPAPQIAFDDWWESNQTCWWVSQQSALDSFGPCDRRSDGMNYRLCTADSIILQQEDFTPLLLSLFRGSQPTLPLTPNPASPSKQELFTLSITTEHTRGINEGAPKSDYLILMKFYHFVQHGATPQVNLWSSKCLFFLSVTKVYTDLQSVDYRAIEMAEITEKCKNVLVKVFWVILRGETWTRLIGCDWRTIKRDVSIRRLKKCPWTLNHQFCG